MVSLMAGVILFSWIVSKFKNNTMKEYTEKIGDHLNDILEKNIDAQKGFEKAVENT